MGVLLLISSTIGEGFIQEGLCLCSVEPFEALGAHFGACAIGKTPPLEVGVLAYARRRVIMTAQERALAAPDRSFAADSAVLHKTKA